MNTPSFSSRKFSFLLEFGVSVKLELAVLYKTEGNTRSIHTCFFNFRCFLISLPCKAKLLLGAHVTKMPFA